MNEVQCVHGELFGNGRQMPYTDRIDGLVNFQRLRQLTLNVFGFTFFLLCFVIYANLCISLFLAEGRYN